MKRTPARTAGVLFASQRAITIISRDMPRAGSKQLSLLHPRMLRSPEGWWPTSPFDPV